MIRLVSKSVKRPLGINMTFWAELITLFNRYVPIDDGHISLKSLFLKLACSEIAVKLGFDEI